MLNMETQEVYVVEAKRTGIAEVGIGTPPKDKKEVADRFLSVTVPELEKTYGLRIKADYPPNYSVVDALDPQDFLIPVIEYLLKYAMVKPEWVENFVLSSVVSQKMEESMIHSPADVIAIRAGMNLANGGTVEKACSSGVFALGLTFDNIRLGYSDIGMAAGVEMMSRTADRLVQIGLTDPFSRKLMAGICDIKAKELGITREEHDDYAFESCELARKYRGANQRQIVPINIGWKWALIDDEEVVAHRVTRELLARLKPYFEGGIITSGNSSKYGNAAAAILLASAEGLKKRKLAPLAKVLAWAAYKERESKDFIVAPEGAISKALALAGLSWDDIGFFEDNEAFATSPLHLIKTRGIPRHKMNPRGGAIAHGHPIGATGVVLGTKLIYILKETGARYGVLVTCNAVGEAVAMVFENFNV